jgi:MtN3 and saliva related transmembrane protein
MNAETIIGLIAATLTTIAYLPQAIKIIRTRHTKDLSLLMYIVLTIGIVLWLIYGLMLSILPIILANIVTLTLTSIILALKMKYN